MRENWLWRVSGGDALNHAFAAEGGYVSSHTTAVLLTDCCGHCYVREVDVYRSLCGHDIPIAALMPHGRGHPCGKCEHVISAPCEMAA